MKNVCQEFGIYIKQRRLERGLTQEEVAKMLGISQVSYGRYELGQREPGLDLIYRIADALQFDVADFFGEYMAARTERYKYYQEAINGNKDTKQE